ncbi:BTAD domain-containing putative transcriptional regulator [Streptomyces sp. NPDC002519]
MRFEVLGPLRVVRDGKELDLGFPQQRAVLALLLVQTGRPVHMSAIIDVVWAKEPPASATNVVRRYVGALRRVLEPGLPSREPGRRLLSRSGGYLLEAATDEVDLLRFRDLTKQGSRAAATGRPEAALRHFTAALSLWSGPVAMGIPASAREHVRFRAVERELVQTTRMAADAALVFGGTEKVLPVLRRAVELDPLNEQLHARLILILAASGQQAQALAAYDTVRRRLGEELGVSPGPELGAAHTRVLRQQVGSTRPVSGRQSPVPPRSLPRIATVSRAVPRAFGAASATLWPGFAVPAQLPSDLAAFTGRRAELGRLDVAAAAVGAAGAPAGAHSAVLISGMAGVGKTTLAVHWAHRAAERFPDGRLHVALHGCDPVSPAHALRGVLVSLGVSPRDLPDGVDALARLYRGLLAGRRFLVLLDEAAGLEQVCPLLPASPGCLALITSRNRMPGLVASGARPLRLDLPSAADARAMLARRIGPGRAAAEPRAVHEIIARCGRLPLALAVVAARAVSRPDFPLAAIAAELRDSRGSLDAFSFAEGASDVRAAFLCSYRFLSPDAGLLFRLLSLHPGTDIGDAAAAALTGLPARRARLLLVELADAYLLTEAGPGRYALHDLLRVFSGELAVAHDSPAGRTAALRRLSDLVPGIAVGLEEPRTG